MPPLYVSMRVAGLEQIKCNTPGAGERILALRNEVPQGGLEPPN